MPQDAFTLRLNAAELDSALRGGKISKINQPAKEELSLLIYTGKRTVKLTVNVNAADCGVYFSETERENPQTAPNFCMLLRKRVQNAEILGVSLVGFERILAFRLSCSTDFSSAERVLYVEVMGKYSNAVLTENGIVVGALKTASLDEHCKRALFPGLPYVFPAPQDKTNPSDREALAALFRARPEDPARFLFAHVAGLAPCTAEQIADAYREGDFSEHVYRYIFSDEISPCVREIEGKPVDFFARSVPDAIPFPTLSAAQTYFYDKRRAQKTFDAEKRKLESVLRNQIKKIEKRLGQIADKRAECADAEETRLKGELLTANLYALSRGTSSCELTDFYDERGRTVKIRLDETLTPAQNAQAYFKRYRKQKRTLEALEPQERELRAELDYAESLSAALAAAESTDDLRSVAEELVPDASPRSQKKVKKQEIPFRSFEKDGFRILAGRNNLQNDKLVRKSAPDDLWLHTQRYHSAHVVVQTDGRAVPDEVLLFAARICAKYSEAKDGDKVPVDYCPVRFVKKPSGAKAGFVVYTDHKTVLVTPVRERED